MTLGGDGEWGVGLGWFRRGFGDQSLPPGLGIDSVDGGQSRLPL